MSEDGCWPITEEDAWYERRKEEAEVFSKSEMNEY